jgi:hypothetical protein
MNVMDCELNLRNKDGQLRATVALPREKSPYIYRTGGWVSTTVGLDAVADSPAENRTLVV